MSKHKLVPLEPTYEMALAAMNAETHANYKCGEPADFLSIWSAMLAAAPDVQGEPVAVGEVESQDPIYFWREIGETDWMECRKDWYWKCVNSPEHDTKLLYTAPQPAAMPPEIPRELLGTIIDEVFDGAVEDVGVIEDIYRAIARSFVEKPAEQQPDPTDAQILAITTAYEQGVGKGHDAHHRGEEIQNPYGTSWGCDKAWHMGYEEGKNQAANGAKSSAVKPRPAPDVSALVEALERIMTWPDGGNRYGQANIKVFAAEALAAHRKQGGES